MRVYKNMLGDNSKIHIDEIATKLSGKPVTLSNAVIDSYNRSSSNGSYIRFGNGIQICWIHSISVPYVNDRYLEKAWTFPAAFNGLAFMVASRNNTWGAWNYVSSVSSTSSSNTQGKVRFWRQNPHPWSSGDTVTTGLLAIGFWK